MQTEYIKMTKCISRLNVGCQVLISNDDAESRHVTQTAPG